MEDPIFLLKSMERKVEKTGAVKCEMQRFLTDRMGVEASLIFLAQVFPTRFLAYPGALKKAHDCNSERISLFYKEGIRLVTLDEHHQQPLDKSCVSCAGELETTGLEVDHCGMNEIHDAEKNRRYRLQVLHRDASRSLAT